MSSLFFDRRRSEHFAEFLDDRDRLRRHRRLRRSEAEMDWGVRMFRRMENLPPGPKVPEEFRDGLRTLLMAAARRGQDEIRAAMMVNQAEHAAARGALARPAVPAGQDVPVGQESRTSRKSAALRSQAPGTGRTRAAVLVGVTAGALALSGVSAASTDSLPGDPLYQVKRSSERAQLALAASDQTRGQLYLEFAHSRAAEARQIGNGLLADVLLDMNGETEAGVGLLTSAAVQRGDATILTAITTFVAQQRELLAELHQSPIAAGVEPMRRAITTLDSVEQRTRELIYSLRKGCVIATVDTLGPKPTNC